MDAKTDLVHKRRGGVLRILELEAVALLQEVVLGDLGEALFFMRLGASVSTSSIYLVLHHAP